MTDPPRTGPGSDMDLPSNPSVLDSHHQTLQRLISRTVSQSELASLIETIFSYKKVADLVDRLQGSDVQTFIDVIDEVWPYTLPHSRQWLIGFCSDLLCSVGCVGTGCPQFITPNPREMCQVVIQNMRQPLPAP